MNLRLLGLHKAEPQKAELEARQHHHSDGGGAAATLFSIVFETATPTFNGPIEGFSTNFGPPAIQTGNSFQTPPVVVTQTFNPQSTEVQPTPTFEQPTPTHVSETTHAGSTSISEHHTTSQSPFTESAFNSATSQTLVTQPTTANGALETAAPTAAPTSLPTSSNQGLPSGAKAGIAIGVILGIGALAALAFVVFRTLRRKQDEREEEKQNPFGDSAAAPPPPPKLNRGMTPPLVPPMGELPRPSTAGTHGPFGNSNVAQSMASLPPPEPPINPFGNHAQIGSQSSFNGSIPIGDDTQAVSPISHDSDKEIIGAAIGGGVAGAAIGAAVGGGMSARENAPRPLELDGSRPMPPFANSSVPASPSPSQYSFTSAAGAAVAGVAGAAAGAAASAAGSSNVYRVQLDFHPSMHDEMELRSGELVRMLHEYDDGWALCVKFDKSARGVCPRTCLSQKPLQPRARPRGPSAPGPRGPPAPGRTASPGPRGPPPPGRTASPAPSGPRMNSPPSRTASPAPPQGVMPSSRSASPAPGPGPQSHPNLANWPAKPINASKTPNLSNWPAQPVNFKSADMVKRSMSPGPYGGGPQDSSPSRPMGPVKRRSQSVGNIAMPGPGAPGPMPAPAQEQDAMSSGSRSLKTSAEFQLPIMGTPTSVSRKPLPGQV